MAVLLRLYAGWLWQDIKGLDGLVLWPPMSQPDDPAAFARELYHRHLAHLLSIRLWRLEWLTLAAAAVLLLLASLVGRGHLGLGIGLAIVGAIAAAVGARYEFAYLLSEERLKPDQEAAEALVRRVCLRDVPAGTPPDLADPWRHGWITADGRPVAAEIGEFDLRSTELVARAKWCFLAALAVTFLFIDYNKLHLAWLIPLCWIISFSTIGKSIGTFIAQWFGFVPRK